MVSKFALATTLSNETDKLALLKFKSHIDYPLSVLASWNESFHFCQWDGVTCGNKHQRVIGLDLNNKKLVGTISPHIGNLSFLRSLTLERNSFYGGIPSEAGCLNRLQNLNLSYNSLQGEIPVNLSHCSNLKNLDLQYNHLVQEIPSELGSLSKLEILSLANNQLSGRFPPSLGNLSSLQQLLLAFNNLEGEIPNTVAQMKNLKAFVVATNNLSGVFPPSLYNLSSLTYIALTANNFFGNLKPDLGIAFPNLQILYIGINQFIGTIPTSLSNASDFQQLEIPNNHFRGTIPISFGNIKNLQRLGAGFNLLGSNSVDDLSFLSSLNNCRQLTYLNVGYNQIGGNIPPSIGKLSNLSVLSFGANKLTGEIPSSFGNMTKLLGLYLYNNSLEGSIPSSLGNCSYLLDVHLCHNKLNGTIPSELIGTIPDISKLKGIQYLDLSHNNLSGQIPSYMVNFPMLKILNLSFNNLEGEVPIEGVFRNASVVEVEGNSALCGGIQELHLHACPIQGSKKHRKQVAFKLILAIGIPAFCLTLLSMICLYRLRKSKKNCLSVSSFGNLYHKISYKELLNAIEGFSLRNLIGSGNFGSVYEGKLSPDKRTVAVKVLNLQKQGASKSFVAECKALRNMRHRNLVKILAACSSIDFEGNDFKALVYEFMPNGSLEMWLHPEDTFKQMRNLNLLQRMNIAIDVASALLYLHHHCEIPIIHCDLKPSNILLDDDLTAHISDFGLARLLSKSGKEAFLNQLSSAGIKGTVGYVALEYGMGSQLSTNEDVYSFGILLLEMFTGRRPTDELFKDNLNLHNFVKLALPGRVMEIVDQSIFNEVGEIQNMASCWSDWTSEQTESLILVFQIGLACSAESPRDRIDMRRVAQDLLSLKAKFLWTETHE
uniref:non-specific serine/threonine protein kinase n=1 Tax=Fagus sylvatica TaxID=28930 RepID=A0A2N9G4I6_FAGSY